MTIRPVGDELFYGGGQTDRHDEVDSRSSSFAKGPKNINGQLQVPASLTPSKVHRVSIIQQIRDGKVKGKYQHCTVLGLEARLRNQQVLLQKPKISKFELEIPHLKGPIHSKGPPYTLS